MSLNGSVQYSGNIGIANGNHMPSYLVLGK